VGDDDPDPNDLLNITSKHPSISLSMIDDDPIRMKFGYPSNAKPSCACYEGSGINGADGL
jgi:hypothetical protein